MKDITQLNALTKFQLDTLKSITPDIMKVYKNIKIDTFSDSIRKLIPDVLLSSNNIKLDTFSDSIKKLIPDILLSNNNIKIDTFYDSIRKLIPDLLLSSNNIKIDTFSDSIKKLIPDIFLSSNNIKLDTFSDSIRKLIPDVLQNNNFTTMSSVLSTLNSINLNAISNINFVGINSINTTVEKTVNEISEKEEYDEIDIEKVKSLGDYALGISLSNNLPVSVKKNILLNFLHNLWKLLGIPQFQFLLGIIAIIITIYSPSIPHKIIINNTINQIIIIEKENKELDLRGIVNNNVKLYGKPNTKSIPIFSLECGDIIEVLKKNKKWIYVRVYKTDIEGWVLKKYTKGPKNRKTNYLNI